MPYALGICVIECVLGLHYAELTGRQGRTACARCCCAFEASLSCFFIVTSFEGEIARSSVPHTGSLLPRRGGGRLLTVDRQIVTCKRHDQRKTPPKISVSYQPTSHFYQSLSVTSPTTHASIAVPAPAQPRISSAPL